jgi:hypothetical protein
MLCVIFYRFRLKPLEDFIYLMNGLKPIPIDIPLQIIIPAISYNNDAEKHLQASF